MSGELVTVLQADRAPGGMSVHYELWTQDGTSEHTVFIPCSGPVTYCGDKMTPRQLRELIAGGEREGAR